MKTIEREGKTLTDENGKRYDKFVYRISCDALDFAKSFYNMVNGLGICEKEVKNDDMSLSEYSHFSEFFPLKWYFAPENPRFFGNK